MITGSEAESRALMMNAAIHTVAQFGFEGFTTKKWAAEAGVAEGSLYYHFKSKHDLLDETFFMIDHEIADLISDPSEVPEVREELRAFVEQQWITYYHYLLDNPQKTLYYYRFKNSPRFTDAVQKREETYFDSFVRLVEAIDAVVHFADQITIEVLWYFIMDVTTAIAFRVITGGAVHSRQTEHEILGLIMNGITSLS